MRAELNVPWSANLVPHVIGGDEAMMGRLSGNAAKLTRMAKLDGAVACRCSAPMEPPRLSSAA